MKKVDIKKLKKLFINLLKYGVPAGIITVLLIRLTIRDHVLIITSIYYAISLPVLIGVALFSFAVLLYFKEHKPAVFLLLLAFFCIGWRYHVSYYTYPGRASSGDIKLLCWNLYKRINKNYEGIATIIETQKPDIIGFVEFGSKNKEYFSKLQKRFPEYSMILMKKGMLFAVKGEIKTNSYHIAGADEFGKYHRMEVFVNNRKLVVYVVDIGSSPHHPRDFALNALHKDSLNEKDTPLIMMGDFNTPYESYLFDQYRENYQHLFASCGNGFIETWPLPFTLIAIDHIWISKDIHPTSCQVLDNSFSDHKAVIGTIRLKTAAK